MSLLFAGLVMRLQSAWHSRRENLCVMFLALASAAAVGAGHAFILDLKADPRMLLQPWLIHKGFVQYVHIADEHAPLLPQILAWLAPLANGDMLLVLRVAQAVLIAATIIAVVSWVGSRNGWPAAMASGLFFWGWSVYFGYSVLWHNLALSLVYFLFFVVLVEGKGPTPARTIGLGLLTGIAILLKQHAIFLVPVYLISVVWHAHERRSSLLFVTARGGLYAVGIVIALVGYLAYYLSSGGTLPAFYYWFFAFNLESNYTQLGWLLPRPHDLRQIAPAFILVLPCLDETRNAQQNEALPRASLFLLLLLFLSLVFQFPRYSVAHWAVALPFVAAMSGIICGELFAGRQGSRSWRPLYVGFVLLWFLQGTTHYWPYWQGERSQQIVRYDELKELATRVSPHLPQDGSLLLVPNNEAVDNLYYLLGSEPPRYWVMHYSWFANPRTIAAWLAAVDAEQPETLLFFEQHSAMLDQWPDISRYVYANYETAAVLSWDGFPV